MSVPTRDMLREWLSRIQGPAGSSFGFDNVSPRVRDELGSDLAELIEEMSRLVEAFGETVVQPPSAEALETTLIDMEVGLHHAMSHWKSAIALLRSIGCWQMEDLI